MQDNQIEDDNAMKIYLCLGYALHKDNTENIQLQDELKQRLDYLVEHYTQSQTNNNSQNKTVIIVSGRGKVDLESKFMQNYLLEKHNINKEIIWTEQYSMNTVENFLFSFYEIWKRLEKQAPLQQAQKKKKIELFVVTSDFHVKRVQYIVEASAKVLLPAFKYCEFMPLQLLGSKSSSGRTEEPPILWEKASEKINRILNFQFDINVFTQERELIEEQEKNNFIQFINLVKN